MYDKSDPRAALAPVSKSMLGVSGLIAEPQTGYFYQEPPQIVDLNGQTWMTRSHNFIVSLTKAQPGANFIRTNQIDEYAVLLPEKGAKIEWNGTLTDVPGNSLAFVPAGDSTVTTVDGGQLVRVFSTASTDLARACGNADGYNTPRSHIPDFQPWPAPAEGWKVRHYSLDIAPQEGRFGRIFRCTTLMLNVLYPYDGPRDRSMMSPHHHDDFEQVSLALSGTFTHYLRWQWTTDMADWRPDEALEMGAPSVLVIPPPVIHTTRATGEGMNLLVDIFGPPRVDFSLEPGWVLNADDYPMPDQPADQEA